MPNNGAYNNQAANAAERNIGPVGLTRAPVAAAQGLLFSPDLNALPDYTSSNELPQAFLDQGWTSRRNGEVKYSPATGYPSHHDAFEVKTLSGDTEKAMVIWRESWVDANGDRRFVSDGILTKAISGGKSELFSRFKIKFQPGWTNDGQSKFFRFSSVDENGSPYSFFTDGDNAPVVFWDYGHNSFGVRNFIALRGHVQTHEASYFMANPVPSGLPRAPVSGDMSLNFADEMTDLNGDGTNDNPVTMIDRTTGQTLNATGTITHDQIYGYNEWNTIEVYVKMNSAPGVEDGVLKQWINGQLTFFNSNIPWMTSTSSGGRLWNSVSFGGNHAFDTYPNGSAVEEWAAIKDIEVYDRLPGDMQ